LQIPWSTNIQNYRCITLFEQHGYESLAEISRPSGQQHLNRGVEMLLLVKNEGRWQIVSQACDTESPSKLLPDDRATALPVEAMTHGPKVAG